jgi:hypothetical protein
MIDRRCEGRSHPTAGLFLFGDTDQAEERAKEDEADGVSFLSSPIVRPVRATEIE